MKCYPAEIEIQMQRYYQSLSEKDRRRYAAIEAVKLGYGGLAYMSRLFGCHYETLQLGLSELQELQNEAVLNDKRIRQGGGGRKSAFETIAGLDAAFLRVIEQHTAGSPMSEAVKWTHLTQRQISELLQQHEGIRVSVTVVDQLLEKHQFRKRKAVKTLSTGESEQRNEQFETITTLKQTYQAAGNPVMSMDTKKEN
jgi:hypothetical protein